MAYPAFVVAHYLLCHSYVTEIQPIVFPWKRIFRGQMVVQKYISSLSFLLCI